MNDEITNDHIPSRIKGTGYFTPMDLHPVSTAKPQNEKGNAKNGVGMPSVMENVPVPNADTPKPTNDKSNGSKN